MTQHALFPGLIFDEQDRPLETETIGQESFYIVDDDGFRRYIPSIDVDRQIWNTFSRGVEGNEDMLSAKTAEMMGKDDLLTVAMLKTAMKDFSNQFDELVKTGLPIDALKMFGMMGFKFTVDIHGELVDLKAPTAGGPDDDEEEE